MMDNILYVGPYREFSGMGNASRQYIKSLIRSGHNISIRPIYNIFKPYPAQDIDNEILELENNFSKSYHAVIQHCYPHQLVLDKRFNNNIGIVHLESNNYGSSIIEYLSIMDKIIVGSNITIKNLSACGMDPNKLHMIPEPIDIEPISYYKNNNQGNKNTAFSFYTIADFVDRKNLDIIIKAYSLAFDQDDGVDLVIKLKNFSDTDIHINETLDYYLAKIYNILKRKNIKKPRLIFGNTKYEGILYMHHNNDCFINCSSGESFGYSTLEAMAFNNNIIVNEKISSSEIITDNCGLLTKTKPENCNDSDRLYFHYNTIDNIWVKPELDSLIMNMYKAANENDEQKQNRIRSQNDRLQFFTLDKISDAFNIVIKI